MPVIHYHQIRKPKLLVFPVNPPGRHIGISTKHGKSAVFDKTHIKYIRKRNLFDGTYDRNSANTVEF